MNLKHPLILASSSPRRQFLLKAIGFQFFVERPDIDETFPREMPAEEVALFLAEKKANVFSGRLVNEMILTSDTVVLLDGSVLNKPADRKEAIGMLMALSGKTHTVITGVCLMSAGKIDRFQERTDVTFKRLRVAEIESYVDHYKPFDKAGAYGAQECLAPGFNPCSKEEIEFLKKIQKTELIRKSISNGKSGLVAIEKIKGSYFNVMGLPIHKVYTHLIQF
jgi:septum formation protein